jgi:hypothetical protein
VTDQLVDEMMDAMGLCSCGNPKTNKFLSTRYEDGYCTDVLCCGACGKDLETVSVIHSKEKVWR